MSYTIKTAFSASITDALLRVDTSAANTSHVLVQCGGYRNPYLVNFQYAKNLKENATFSNRSWDELSEMCQDSKEVISKHGSIASLLP